MLDTKKTFGRTIYCCSSTDRNYVMPTCVTIASVCLNNSESYIVYFLVVSGLSSQDYEQFTLLESRYRNLKLSLVDFNIEFLDSLGVLESITKSLKDQRLTASTYVRLFLTELLPNTVNKVLFLDTDIICQNSIDRLYSLNLKSDTPLAAVLDIAAGRQAKRLHVSNYVNAGVLLINLEYWRKHEVIKLFCECLTKNTGMLLTHDQDVINLVFADKIEIIPRKWNFQFFAISSYSTQHLIKEATIVHYITEQKPWIGGNCNQQADIWMSYYERCFNKRFEYKQFFSLKRRLINKISLISLKFLPYDSKRRKLIKRIVPQFLRKLIYK